MSNREPVRPPRGSKRPQESSGLLISVIRALSASQDNEQRDREKAKLEKDFKRSDQRLDDLVQEHQEELLMTIQSFSKIASRVSVSQDKIRSVKEKLVACKMLLHCKRDELKKLWLEGIEHKHVLFLLEQIEKVKDVPQKVDENICNRDYLQATELVVDAAMLLEGSLEAVDALKEVRNSLQSKKEHLYELLLDALQQELYKIAPSKSTSQNAREQLPLLSPRQTNCLTLSDNQSECPTATISSETSRQAIFTVVHCLYKLNKIPDAVESVKEKCQSELLDVNRSIVKDFVTDSILPQHKHSAVVLNAFLIRLFDQYKEVVKMHEHFLGSIRKIYSSEEQQSDVHLYSVAEVWSKVQAVLETVIGEYLDISNRSSARQPPHPVFTETTADIATFFARKRNVKQKKYSLFRFDGSSHAININNYLKEQKQAENEDNCGNAVDDEPKLVCHPHPKNITVIYKPCMQYVQSIEEILQYNGGNHCPLHSFLADCVKIFMSQVSEDITHSVEMTTKSLEAWKSVSDSEAHESLNLVQPILQSTVIVDKMVNELKSLAVDLPVCRDHFLELMCSVLRSYKETCLDAYRGIVQPESEDKRIISATWAKDEDINRLLQTLPNWLNVKNEKWNSEQEESAEQVRLHNTRESEILAGNLGDMLIPKHEILSDVGQLKLLAQLQESMEWFGKRILEFARDLRNQTPDSSPVHQTVTSEEFDIGKLDQLSEEYTEIGDTCLLVLHLEVRVHCFYYVLPITRQSSFASGVDLQEPDPEVTKLIKDLGSIDEVLASSLQQRKCRYVFEGLGHLISNIIINGIQHIKRINENGIKKMCRNIFAVQQNLTNITMSREVGLDRTRQCFELMYLSLQEILDNIVEHGVQFTQLEYTSILHLLHRSTPGNDASQLNNLLERLNDLMADGAVTV